MADKIAQFGSGLLSVVFCNPHVREMGVQVIVGRPDSKFYNDYFNESNADEAFVLDKTTDVRVTITCNETGEVYDTAVAGHNIPDVDNDPIVRVDPAYPHTWYGDCVRRHFFTDLDPNTEYTFTVTTDAVNSNGNGKLQSLTLTGKTQSLTAMKIGTMTCCAMGMASSVATPAFYIEGSGFITVGEAFDHYYPDDPRFTIQVPKGWPMDRDRSGNVIHIPDTTDLEVGEVYMVGSIGLFDAYDGSNVGAPRGVATVSAIDGNGNVTITDQAGNPFDFTTWDEDNVKPGGLNKIICPLGGYNGAHVNQMLDNGITALVWLDDEQYSGQRDISRCAPPYISSNARGGIIYGSRGRTNYDIGAIENHSIDRADGEIRSGLFTRCRAWFCQAHVLEAGQRIPITVIRGDHSVTPRNDWDHAAITPIDIGVEPYATWAGEANVSPFADANYPNRLIARTRHWQACQDSWMIYFAGLHPVSFVTDIERDEYPPALTKDLNTGVINSVDPITTYGARKVDYYLQTFAIENDVACFIAPDFQTKRGVKGNSLVNDFIDETGANLWGGEGIMGPHQVEEIKAYFLKKKQEGKQVSFMQKSQWLDVDGDGDVTTGNNADAPVRNAPVETEDILSFIEANQNDTHIQVGDRHEPITGTRATRP